MTECGTCDHPISAHPDGGPCQLDGCDCETFVDSIEPDAERLPLSDVERERFLIAMGAEPKAVRTAVGGVKAAPAQTADPTRPVTVEDATGGRLSRGDGIAKARKVLDERDDLGLRDRVALAMIVATGGTSARDVTIGQLAEVADLPPEDVVLGLTKIAEENGIDGPKL